MALQDGKAPNWPTERRNSSAVPREFLGDRCANPLAKRCEDGRPEALQTALRQLPRPCTNAEGKGIKAEESSAPNLFAYGTRKWVSGWLDPEQISGPNYFGNTAFSGGDMVGFVKEAMADLEEEDEEDVAAIVTALSAQAKLKSQAAPDKKDTEQVEYGMEMMTDVFGCTDCHKLGKKGQLGTAPDLTGYASREWTAGIIANPAAARFYRDTNDRMPAYAENEDDPSKNLLSKKQIELLTDWLRGEWYEPEVGEKAEEAKPAERKKRSRKKRKMRSRRKRKTRRRMRSRGLFVVATPAA